MPPNSARERLTLDEGPAVLEWPGELSADSVRDLEDWIKVVVKRMKRRAGIKDSDDDSAA
jgi:adenine-specific DNA methylase